MRRAGCVILDGAKRRRSPVAGLSPAPLQPLWEGRVEQPRALEQSPLQPEGEEAAEGADGLHRPPAADAGEELREAEVPQRAGQDGAGRQAQPHRHPGQDVVPEQKVIPLSL
ncbi:hypothetical protein CDAR_417191 [Caerostris darwini]|uniref:Uncharacterized protein n=1 Tax=Caerostris darwini TaxID=1538125 RepID=A0AAV4X846_9ARAC|nr:hypothetical protein CDAR_417191 [Caerostris darwini]